LKEHLSQKGKKRILFSAFITLLNDRLSESILLPLLPSFILLYADSASAYGLLSCTYQLAQFIASPVIGAQSDRIGRKPVMLICITGSIIGISILAFTVLFDWSQYLYITGSSFPIFLLFISRLIDGFSGGTAATATTVLADLSSPEKRAKTFGLIGVAFGLSFALGNICVLIFAKNTNNNVMVPIIIASIIPIINFILVALYLPETKPSSNSINNKEQISFNPFSQLFKVFKEKRIRKLSLAFFMYFVAFTGLTNILLYFLRQSLGWTSKASSGTLVAVGIIAIIVQGLLIGPLVKLFGEMKLTLSGAGFILFACFVLITCPKDNAVANVYLAVSFLAIGAGLITPSLRALISRKLDINSQGSILSNLQGMQSLGGVIGAVLAGNIYDQIGPKSPFFAGSIILLIMVWLITEGKTAERCIK
tara:strand:- start:11363 stop:12628 length:1266 start_codon:yes stop_codon:yes gene_type:complete